MVVTSEPSKSVCAYAVTSVNVQLGQCYDTIVITIYAALYSLQSTSTFVIRFDIHLLSRRSDASCLSQGHKVISGGAQMRSSAGGTDFFC